MQNQGVILTLVGLQIYIHAQKGVYKVASHYSTVWWFVVLLSGSLQLLPRDITAES